MTHQLRIASPVVYVLTFTRKRRDIRSRTRGHRQRGDITRAIQSRRMAEFGHIVGRTAVAQGPVRLPGRGRNRVTMRWDEGRVEVGLGSRSDLGRGRTGVVVGPGSRSDFGDAVGLGSRWDKGRVAVGLGSQSDLGRSRTWVAVGWGSQSDLGRGRRRSLCHRFRCRDQELSIGHGRSAVRLWSDWGWTSIGRTRMLCPMWRGVTAC